MNGVKGLESLPSWEPEVPKYKHGHKATPQEVSEAGAVPEEKWAPTWWVGQHLGSEGELGAGGPRRQPLWE